MTQPQWNGFPAQPQNTPQFNFQPWQPPATNAYMPVPPSFPAPTAPVVLANGNLDDFFGAPSVSGGPSWSFKDKQIGTTYQGIISRPITNADVQQQTTPGTGLPATYRDGRPKWVMKVPLTVQPDANFPDGEATWFVTGQSRDELVRAMRESGAPDGPPEVGAQIQVTLVNRKPSKTPGFNPSNQVMVRYVRPNVETASPASTQLHTNGQSAQATPGASPSALVPPGDLTPEQQALLARLTGNTAA